MISVKVRYFAVFREERGLSEESVQTESSSAGQLYEELQSRYGFRLDPKLVRVAIQGSYVPMQAPLQNGDEVVLIPPVAGG